MSKDSRIQDELSSSMTGGRLRRYAKVTSAMGGLLQDWLVKDI